MGHEQGHNFFGGMGQGAGQFYIQTAGLGPFLQESLAVISSIYTYRWICSNPNLDISLEARKSLDYVMAAELSYQARMAASYKSFDINDILTSQALGYVMIRTFDEVGWDKCNILTKAFVNRNDIEIPDDRVSYIAAVLSKIKPDVSETLISMGFPVDRSKLAYYLGVI
jgi:hypothetical protein